MPNKKNNEEEILSAYVSEQENTEMYSEQSPIREEATVEITPVEETPKKQVEQPRLLHPMPMQQHGQHEHNGDNLGYRKIPIDSLPTQGLFYPDGFEVSIRAARGEEIKHWSTMNDQDLQQLSRTDDIMSYMIEKCCAVKCPGRAGNCWKDLKNVDRFYILLAIREFTFLDDTNNLMVPLGEGKEMPVTKEMIDFVQIPEELMRFYSSEEKCFVLNVNGLTIKIHIPSIGVNNFIKDYAQRKSQAREMFDQDFITYAPMLVKDYRLLNDRNYEELVASSRGWGVKEWSVVSYVTDILGKASEPIIKYEEENGNTVSVPLTFRGGIKALFSIYDPLSGVH